MTEMDASVEDRLRALSQDKAALLETLLQVGTPDRAAELRPCYRDSREGAGDLLLLTSWAQHRLWFIDQLEQGSAGYFIPLAIRLRGPLDLGALQTALDAIVQRHEVLRTVFVDRDGEPDQKIQTAGRFALTQIDLRTYGEDERELQVQLQKKTEALGKFDLRVGPLIRGRLLRVEDEAFVLLITMHHIVSDGWSIGVFVRDLTRLYGAYRHGIENPLVPLRIQYADYAQWQREWIRGEFLDGQLRYWRSRLEGAPPQLELPTDRPRPASQSYSGDNVPIVVDPTLSAKLRFLAQRYDMTLFMVLYAAWALLLSRLSGQQDVVIGAPVANRQRPELETLIGFFANTLALRTEVRPDWTLQDFLSQIKEVTLGAYDHQDVPFEKVVEALQPERSLSRNPLFQVMLALNNTPQEEVQLPGLTAKFDEGKDEPSIFDLFISLEDRNTSICGYVNYATDLFERETITRWVGYLNVLLGKLADGFDGLIGELSILPESERRQVIESFNDTAATYSSDMLIHELFERQVQRTPDTVAIIYGQHQVTYTEVNRKANQLARRLVDEGIGPDRLVGICAERGIDMVVGLLGTLKAGGAYLPLDPNYPSDRLHHMLADAAPRVLLTQESLRSILPPTQGKLIAVDSLKHIAGNAEDNLLAVEMGLTARNLVYVIYTSGSTGRPKGTAMTHRSMVNLIEWHRESLPLSEGQRVLQFAALSFDVAFQETFSTLCNGGTLVLLDESIRRDARALLEFLRCHNIERVFLPPLMLQSLSEYAKTCGMVPERLKDVITAGEQLRITPEIASFLKSLRDCRLHNHYGPTETHVVTAMTLGGDPEHWPALPAIGRPVANTRIYVLDGRRQPEPIGVAGEIYIGGAGVARGYLNRPELTDERFIADPFSPEPEARIYKTGDLGRWRRDGTIEYLGRNDDQVKIRGFRIELGEIEAELTKHEHVKDAVVVAREDIPGERRLVAYVTRRDNIVPIAQELRAHLRAILPEHMVPSAFVVLGGLPTSPNGKLDRRALPAPELGAYVSREYEAPQGETEQVLAGVWQEVLGVEQIGRLDNFFELGGHSLLAMKLIVRTAERLMVDLSVVVLFRNPTIQQMSKVVEAVRESRVPQALAANNSGGADRTSGALPRVKCAPLTYTQLQHWNLYQLGERPAFRFVASATRLHGRFNIDAFRRSITAVVRRHEALRTRIVICDGTPMQEVAESPDWSLKVEDLVSPPEGDSAVEMLRRIEEIILQPIDITVGPLFEAKLLRISDRDHVLILAAEHIISDASSLRIFLRDAFAAYEQYLSGRALSLPEVDVQFAGYALRQRAEEKSWSEKHRAYWNKRLAGCERLRFPVDENLATDARSGWGIAPVQIGKELKAELREWCRQRGTTSIMGIFTAYVALVLRWCNASDGVVQFMSNSRDTQDVENTFGFFASPLHLRIEIFPRDTFIDLLKRTTEEYCNAYEHADFSYLEAQSPRPEFTRNTVFNWIPQIIQSGPSDLDGSEDAIACSQVHFDLPFLKILERDGEPLIVLYDTDDGAVGGVYFPLDQFSPDSMARFASNFLIFIKALLRQPEQRVKDVQLASAPTTLAGIPG